MTPAVVVDIGNSRMKWGRVADGKLAEHQSLPHDNERDWERQFQRWRPPPIPWLIASVSPRNSARLVEWLTHRGIPSRTLDNGLFLKFAHGFRTIVEEPDRLGIDRLLASFTAHRLASSRDENASTVAVVSVGTATTIDFVDSEGTHHGGAILPGPRLMALALKDSTAQLPEADVGRYRPEVLAGVNTHDAIRLGITRATIHAANSLIHDWAGERAISIFLTGGDADIFRDFSFTCTWTEVAVEPALTLEGLRFIAESLP